MADRIRVGILLSGRGSNFEAIAEHRRKDPDRAYDVAFVVSNVPEARGLVLARRLGIPTWSQSHKGMERAAFDALVDAELRRHDVEVVALAGYMRLLSPEFTEKWKGRVLNIHPSLLPAYKGLDTHGRAILAGEEYAGCSIHVVTAELDDGPVIAQKKVKILPRDTAETLAERVLREEHKLYPEALDQFCRSILDERQALT